MFKNYFFSAIRNLWQQRFYSVLNIAGLSLGLASIVLISLWVNDELQYDSHFQNSRSIYRIECSLVTEGVPEPMIATDRRMANYLNSNYNKACTAVAVFKTPTLLVSGEKTLYQENAFYVDTAFFSVFSFQFVLGNPRSALIDSSSVVITEQTAQQLFGDKNPIGDTIWINNNQTHANMIPRVVTGVVKANNKASHFHPSVIFAKRRNMDVFEPVYVLFKKGYQPDYFKKHIWKAYYRNIIIPNYAHDNQDLKLDILKPITEIHLSGNKWEDFEVNNSRSLLYVFALISALILTLACINYINIGTSRLFSRIREIAIRKILGASRVNIISQFLFETILTTLIALLIAFALVEVTLPIFNNLADKQIHLYQIGIGLLSSIVLFTIIVGVIVGIYPALRISSFRAADVIRDLSINRLRKDRIRRVLIVLQFSISMVMLIVTFHIWRQLVFMKTSDLGFNSKNVLLIPLNDEKVYLDQDLVKHALLKNPDILGVAVAHNVPGSGVNHTYISFESADTMKALLINSMFVDAGFADVLQLKFTEGHNFDSNFKINKDSTYIIINESARKDLGYENAIGKKINGGTYYGGVKGHIIGVVKDFHALSLHEPTRPMALILGTLGRPEGKSKFMMVKLKPRYKSSTIDFIRKTYLAYGQGYPFHSLFLDEQFNAQYQKEEKQMTLFDCFTIISLFTSLLGLVGLAIFFVEYRTKEICIRRISGASTREIFYEFSKDYGLLIIIAWLLACPVAYFVVYNWLHAFAYHIKFNLYPYLGAGLIVSLLVFVVLIIQTKVLIRMKPADILRHQ